MRVNNGLRLGVALVVIVALGVALLYAYRSQVPARQSIPYSAALAAVQEGRVRSVHIEDGRATLTLMDGSQQQATVPDDGMALARAIQDHDRTEPTRPIELRYMNGSPGLGAIFPVLFSLLPLLVLVALILVAASAFARARAPDRFDALARLGELRDRGIVTEEEFQREKRRILG